jgi:plasmid stabilization system protein ParE
MYKVIILPDAKSDIKEAAVWFNKKQKGLGKRFTTQIREKILFIQQNPKAVATRYKNTKTAVVSDFPFMIHYSIDQSKELVIISAVFHTSLSPENWEKR